MTPTLLPPGSCTYVLSILVTLSPSLIGQIASWELKSFLRHLEIQYFQKAYCVALVTEDRLQNKMSPDVVPYFHIILSSKNAFREQVIPALDAACSVFIFQVADPKSIILQLHKITRYSVQNIPKRFIFLPILEDPSNLWSSNAECDRYLKDLFSLREMDFVPDLLFVRMKMFDNTKKATHISTTDTNSVSIPQTSAKTETASCTLLPSERSFRRGLLSKTNKEYLCDIVNGTAALSLSKTFQPADKRAHAVELEILTHSFHGPDPSRIIHLDTWTSASGFLLGNNLFESKIDNLKGKALIPASVNYPPYVLQDLTATPPLIEGLEIRCLQEFGRRLNSSFKYMDDQGTLWGEAFENGSTSGLLGFVIEGNADFGLGSFYYAHPLTIFAQYAVPLSRSEATCLTPRPKLLSRLLTPVLPFPLKVWIAVIASVIIIGVLLYVLARVSQRLTAYKRNFSNSQYRTITDSLIAVWGMLLLQVPSDEDKNAAIRHFIAWAVLFFMLVNSIYSSGLAACLTIPTYEPPIDTAEDLASSPFLWSANSAIWLGPILGGTDPIIQKVVDKFKKLSDEELEDMFKKGKTAFIAERTAGGTIILPPHLTPESMKHLRPMKGQLYWSYLGIIMRRSSPYAPVLNSFILRLLQTGIPDFWELYVVITAHSQRMYVDLTSSASDAEYELTVLSLDHAQGMFAVLALGLTISTIIFIIELCGTKRKDTEILKCIVI